MNTFKRKSLYAALAGVGALGVTGAAQAVNVSADGLGQVLIYPYYTTNGFTVGGGGGGTIAPYNSLLSVVNSTNSGKVVKVRFLEAKNSREVLDFNLWLSPHDVWTAAIIPSGLGAGIFTTDLSCTTPTVSSDGTHPTNFLNYAYTGGSADGEDITLTRTKEGYVEIIEMGNVTGVTLAAITHAQPSPPGKPPGCGILPTGVTAPVDLVVGQGGLFGGISLVNVLAGGDLTEDAIGLASFSNTTLWAPAGYTTPDLSQVAPKTSVVFNNTEVVTTDWTGITFNAIDPVSAIFMRDNVYNEFVLDTGTKSGTDWVITMPTKRYYYDSSLNVTKLFQRNFRLGGACDDVFITQYNREEATVQSQSSFSPPPPGSIDQLCWEANVLTFNNTNVLASPQTIKQNIGTQFINGWVSLNFFPPSIAPPRHQLVGGATFRTNTGTGISTVQASATYNGLPVVGFAAEYFNNGTLTTPGGTGVQAFYTGAFVHKFTRFIQ
jgi:hypothetical protein